MLALTILHPGAASAQGFPGGGMGSGMGGMGGRGGSHGGRGGRGQRSGQQHDSASAARRENAGTLADVALRHQAEMQLSDSQATALAGIARDARINRLNAVAALAAMRDSATDAESSAAANDSTRRAVLVRRRALATAIAQLHDVDVNARTATLALLSPAQQSTLIKLESAEGGSEEERGPPSGSPRQEH